MKTLKLAVIGKDVSKSVSPVMHNFIAERLGRKISYDKISLTQTEFEGRIKDLIAEYDGLNVTIPYKLSIIPYLERIEGDAHVFGAVNTVNTHKMAGNNTDGLGFMLMLSNSGVTVKGKTALVLGAGGAGRSVAKKLLDGGASVEVFDAKAECALKVAEEFKDLTIAEKIEEKPYDIIVNATGVGMHNTVGISPVSRRLIEQCGIAVDLIYNPPQSKFLEIAEECGRKTINGNEMLFYQAYYAECLFWDITPDDLTAKKLYEEYLKECI